MEKKDIKGLVILLAEKCAMALALTLLLIALNVVSIIILGELDDPLQKLIVQDQFVWGGIRGLKFSMGAFSLLVFEALAIAVVGAILIVRHGWWGKKLLIHTTIWYVVYLMISLGILIYEGTDWGFLRDGFFVVFTIENCLFPLISIMILVVITTIAKFLSPHRRSSKPTPKSPHKQS